MHSPIAALKLRIEPTRAALLAHPVYSQITDFEGLKQFAQYHVFAVWDFMSLLKSLQLGLTCVQLPWVPVGSANTRFLINEIVAGEESDVDEHGNRISHFIPAEVKAFLQFTFQIAQHAPLHVKAAVFTFGREDLIPDMFTEILNKIYTEHPNKVSTFKYYIERHIEIDGGHHSQLALEMVAALCGDDENKWEEAANASIKALETRCLLWNAIL